MQCPSELELLAWLIDTVTPEQVYEAFCVALSFKSRSFSLWQGCLFFRQTSLSFTFTWGVAYNYCLVNSFFCNIYDVQRQQSSKRSRGREVCSLPRMTNSHQGEKRKEKKRKRNAWQSARPRSTNRPLFHQVSLMLLVALSKWYPNVCGHIFQLHCLDLLCCLWNHSLLRWQLQIRQSDFLESQIFYTT